MENNNPSPTFRVVPMETLLNKIARQLARELATLGLLKQVKGRRVSDTDKENLTEDGLSSIILKHLRRAF